MACLTRYRIPEPTRQADIEVAKLKADLGVQTAHAKQLQQQVDDLRKQQQKKRLSVQSNFDPLE